MKIEKQHWKINKQNFYLPYLFEYKSHSSIRRTPKIGPRIRYKFFHSNLKGTLEMHEDIHSDHRSSSLTVVKTMFPMFMHDSPCFFQHFHVYGIAPTNKINKNVTLLEFFGIPGWRILYFPY